ncbi:hypothetical protein CCYA_CCYA14G3749 [Cyanidiococcus yangmingshanensis]|nr:hypothetical protein CCYA_CCYA14G3749 [Cyanidiococcus yangmingshanensis]
MRLELGFSEATKVHVATPSHQHVFCVACHWTVDRAATERESYDECSDTRSVEDVLEKRRAHYRSDWHRVNLKRRVAQLPPLTEAEFEERVGDYLEDDARADGALELSTDEERADKERQASGYTVKAPAAFVVQGHDEPQIMEVRAHHRKRFQLRAEQPHRPECIWCQKVFSSERALEQHERSARHQDKLRELGIAELCKPPPSVDVSATSSTEDMDLDAWIGERLREAQPLDVNECLFCVEAVSMKDDAQHHERHEALLANLRHMAREHSFFVPYIEHCCDLEGLLCYLGTKVGLGFCCIYGGSQVSLGSAPDGATQHADRRAETFNSLQACRNHMRDTGHCKLPDFDSEEVWNEYQEFYSFTPVRSLGELWDGASNGLDPSWSTEECEDPTISDEAPWEPRVAHSDRSESVSASDEDPVGLQVGVHGRIAGHRSFWRYYRQRLVANRRASLPVAIAIQERQKIAGEYRKLVPKGADSLRSSARANSVAQSQASIPPRPLLERWRRAQLAQALSNDATRRGRASRSAIAVLNSGYRG